MITIGYQYQALSRVAKSLRVFTCLGLLILISACAQQQERGPVEDPFALFKSEDPMSILILPPVNLTTAATAPDYYLSTVAEPLSQKGYYVLPVPLTKEVFELEGIVDGKQLQRNDYSLYQKHFGADAVLFVSILEWDTHYMVLAGAVTVHLGFELVSTQSSKLLWKTNKEVTIETTGRDNNLLARAISTALNTATQDYIPIARQINAQSIDEIPAGLYLRKLQEENKKNK